MKKLQKIKNKSDPLYKQIADRTRMYIIDNELKTGTPLPSQNALIKHFDVSQITVRQALQQLIAEGIVTSIQGKGTFTATGCKISPCRSSGGGQQTCGGFDVYYCLW